MAAGKNSGEGTGTSLSCETELSAFGNDARIVVPPELIEQLGAGQRPAVAVDLNGHVYPNTVGS